MVSFFEHAKELADCDKYLRAKISFFFLSFNRSE